MAGSCVSATEWVTVSATLFEESSVAAPWAFDSCISISISAAGSYVSATKWVVGSCVSTTLFERDDVATPWAYGSCVSVPMGGIGKDPGIWEVGGVRGISRMGWGSRVVEIMGGLVEALVHFFHKKGGKKGICFRLCGGLSSMMGQGELSGSESSLRI
jgi:hypothetical protein